MSPYSLRKHEQLLRFRETTHASPHPFPARPRWSDPARPGASARARRQAGRGRARARRGSPRGRRQPRDRGPGEERPARGGTVANLAEGAAPFPKGARCLFIGHSFFVPVARQFDVIARQQDFPGHRSALVFAAGPGGTPAALSRNERTRSQVERQLAKGDVQLLGMTGFGRAGSAPADYQRWIDLAREHNPRTRFLIGACWSFGGPKLPTDRYTQLTGAAVERSLEVIRALREANPGVTIHFIDYGRIATDMKRRFDADQLPEIQQLVGRDPQSRFVDGFIGHGGPLILKLSALSWLDLLYGADTAALTRPLSASAQQVLRDAIAHNRKHR